MRLHYFIFLLLFFTARSKAQIITTIAGTGTQGYSGDGGPATAARLGDLYYTYPAIDNAGNVYIAQNGNNTIRKINAAGIITTIAGTVGVIGYTGDGGPAVNALIYHPTYALVDNNDNLLFGDRNGDIIRRIDPAGIINTITGQFTVNCGVGDGGPLINAQFTAVSAISKDASGNLYIVDFGCNTVRKLDIGTGMISTIAGNGTWGYSGDGGPATAAQLAYPCKVAVDNAGNVYIADAQNHRIRKVTPAGIITTIAGTGAPGYSGDGGPATAAQLRFPGSVVIDRAGNLYIGDDESLIRKIDPSGIITTFAGNGIEGYTGDGGPPALAQIKVTQGRISIDANDNIYFSDDTDAVIRKILNCLAPVVLTQPQPVSLCNSGNAVFSVGASNTNSYQWQVNDGSGWADITDNGVYAGSGTNTLSITGATPALHQFQYRCRLNNGCGNIFTVAANLSVNTAVTPAITISTAMTTVCENATVIFMATPTNGGATPTYQWRRNGLPVGTSSNSLSLNNLSTGDMITCLLTSSGTCVTIPTATSNAITMNVTPIANTSVQISVSGNGGCAGSPVTFTATPVNGGTTPTYTWFKNGTNLFLNSPVYTASNLTNGDNIFCVMGTSLACVDFPVSVSNPIIAAVTIPLTPTITIAASNLSICRNEPVTFTATTTNEGMVAVFQWKKNAAAVGMNSNSYTDNTLTASDQVSCELITNHACATTNSARSNAIVVTINPDPVPLLDQTSWLCTGSTRTLDPGIFNSYLWNTGATGRTITINATGNYDVEVTNSFGCKATATTAITTLLPAPADFVVSDTTICSYGSLTLLANPGYLSYLWSNGSTARSVGFTQPGQYWLEVRDQNNCTGRESITVALKDCQKGLYVPSGFTPDGNGKNDLFKAFLFGNTKQFRLQVFNRWGEIVFSSTDPLKGWDGRYKGLLQDNAVFIWTCLYQLEGEAVRLEKGTVTLIR